MKKKQKDFNEKDCNEEVLEDIAEVPPLKKKHAETTGNKKGKARADVCFGSLSWTNLCPLGYSASIMGIKVCSRC